MAAVGAAGGATRCVGSRGRQGASAAVGGKANAQHVWQSRL
jgi:hypothetical protein